VLHPGEASTLNETGTGLRRVRAPELRQASAELGADRAHAAGLPGRRASAVPLPELETEVAKVAAPDEASGLLVSDNAGHADHNAATARRRLRGQGGDASRSWPGPCRPTSPASFKGDLAPFAGRPGGQVDPCVRVDRTRQRRAALLHASELTRAVLWRRPQLQGDCEHLRWIEPRLSQGVGSSRARADAGSPERNGGPARLGQRRAAAVKRPRWRPGAARDALLAVASHCTVHNTLRREPRISIELDS
jgi:LmbE family N-acetylglucosaminyl deacetylase